jgi:hypothetical protein
MLTPWHTKKHAAANNSGPKFGSGNTSISTNVHSVSESRLIDEPTSVANAVVATIIHIYIFGELHTACTPGFVYLLGAIGDRESVDYVDLKPIWVVIFGSRMLKPAVVEMGG